MQDMDQEDIERNEADLMEMQKSIRKLSESLKSYSFSEEKCDAEEVGEGVKDRPEPPSESEISAKMAEMEKFERVLKMKSEEVKVGGGLVQRMLDGCEYSEFEKC